MPWTVSRSTDRPQIIRELEHAQPVCSRGAPPPPAAGRDALLPPKEVALFLPKEQGKETEDGEEGEPKEN